MVLLAVPGTMVEASVKLMALLIHVIAGVVKDAIGLLDKLIGTVLDATQPKSVMAVSFAL
jgi:hypothetical protein